ncbi:VOC family protein [Glycomyces sp. YM15]|uniref:VOC family protein n=1 Tax=Glycomyces sp. YM15 TaxID=2800446 RepID=UPI001964728A|nr:VOC family protein [Glycomyces sp. YM15]
MSTTTEVGPWPRGISAITVFAEDLDAMKAFYTEVFGLPVRFEDEASVVFDFGNALINVLAAEAAPGLIGPATVAGPETGARQQFTITVDDVDTLCASLAARGVALVNGPLDRPWGVRTAAFADPAGHIWEIAE